MQTLALVALFAVAPGLRDCPDKKHDPVAFSEACAGFKKTLYHNCRLKFTSEEVVALSEENQTKITAVKLFFRQCPEAKACGAK
jgi:hypothetical protein